MLEKNNIIIGFSGKKGAGKTTAAAYLHMKYDFKMVAFADKLKDFSTQLFPFTADQLYGNFKEECYQGYDWTPRDFMMKFGQFMRYWDKNYWLKKVDLDAKLQNIVIHDVRYLNEAEYLKTKNARLVRILRYKKDNPYQDNSTDESETQLDNYDFDFVIPEVGNATLLTLHQSLDYMLKDFELI